MSRTTRAQGGDPARVQWIILQALERYPDALAALVAALEGEVEGPVA